MELWYSGEFAKLHTEGISEQRDSSSFDGDAVETKTVSLLGDSLGVQFGELS